MSTYISSTDNRFYVAVEASYGQAATISAANRIPAVQLMAQQRLVQTKRRDKLGTRTFQGYQSGARRETAFQLRTYLTSWSGTGLPAYGALFEAAMGAAAQIATGLQVATVPAATEIQTVAPHGLSVGSAVSFLGEIRFVTMVADGRTFGLNAPFTNIPPQNAALAPTVTYRLATTLPTVSIYDYWDPVTTISRIITGAAISQLHVKVNGDFHEFVFSGPGRDLLDSQNVSAGTAGLTSFPLEPALGAFDYSIIPGHLGQVWLGSNPAQFFTLTGADVLVANVCEMRASEYGSSYPRAVTPGPRQALVSFSVFVQDDPQTNALYSAAKLRNPIAALLQLGQQQGHLMGIYVPAVVPEMPEFDDAETRLQWRFKNCVGQGISNDEIFVAFA